MYYFSVSLTIIDFKNQLTSIDINWQMKKSEFGNSRSHPLSEPGRTQRETNAILEYTHYFIEDGLKWTEMFEINVRIWRINITKRLRKGSYSAELLSLVR